MDSWIGLVRWHIIVIDENTHGPCLEWHHTKRGKKHTKITRTHLPKSATPKNWKRSSVCIISKNIYIKCLSTDIISCVCKQKYLRSALFRNIFPYVVAKLRKLRLQYTTEMQAHAGVDTRSKKNTWMNESDTDGRQKNPQIFLFLAHVLGKFI